MAFINEQGIKISFECSDLIKELKEDYPHCLGK